MQAVILAAGEGQRLRPLTAHLPKPMLRIGGKPILEHNVKLLVQNGLREIFINLHHRPEAITEYFGDGAAFGASIEYSYEESALGTAGALLPLRERLRSTFLVLYGDTVTTCDLGALIAFHHAKGAAVTLAVYHRKNATAGGIVSIDEDDRISRFLEKPRRHELFSSWVNAGIMVCEPAVFESIPPGVSDFGKDVIPAMIAKGEALYAYRMDEKREKMWWVDSPEDYERTKAELRSWIPA